MTKLSLPDQVFINGMAFLAVAHPAHPNADMVRGIVRDQLGQINRDNPQVARVAEVADRIFFTQTNAETYFAKAAMEDFFLWRMAMAQRAQQVERENAET
jgi:hypothetical protein